MGNTRSAKRRSALGPLFIECQQAIQGEINKLNLSSSQQESTITDEWLPIEGLNGKRLNEKFVDLANKYLKQALSDVCEKLGVKQYTKLRWRKELTERITHYLQNSGEDLSEVGDKLKDVVADFVSIYTATQQFKKDLQEKYDEFSQQQK